jgi:hypothetical protein
MNLTLRKLTGAILAISALLIQDIRADLAGPSAIVNYTIPAGVGSPALRMDLFATPFVRPVAASGSVTGVNTSGANAVFTVTLDASETLPALNNTTTSGPSNDERYILEILDGPAIGLILYPNANTGTSGSGVTITVSGLLGGLDVPSGSRFNIRKDWTLSSLFGAPGPNNPFGSGIDPNDSGVKAWVQVYVTTTGSVRSYYINRNTTTGVYSWQQSTSQTVRDHLRIPTGQGVVIVNKKASPFTFPVSGEYRIARTRLVVPKGLTTFVANPSPVANNFYDSTIVDTTPTVGTYPADATTSDTWRIWRPDTRQFRDLLVANDGTNGRTVHTTTAITKRDSASTFQTIAPFTCVGFKPMGSTTQTTVVTIAPKL